jgi:hypothetical protein
MALVITAGQYPRGKTDFLHIGHKLLLVLRKASTHSGWKMCWQGSSRTVVAGTVAVGRVKSSRQMAQVGWERGLVVKEEECWG